MKKDLLFLGVSGMTVGGAAQHQFSIVTVILDERVSKYKTLRDNE